MSGHERVRRQQLLREAEGYLELTTVFADQWCLRPDIRDQLSLRALDSLDRLGKEYQAQTTALYLRGEAFRIMERYDEAVDFLSAAAQKEPNAHVSLALGWCYKRTGRLDLAIQSLEEALDSDESKEQHGILSYNLACYWSLANNVGLTLAYLAKAIELDVNFRDMVTDEADFDPVRKHPEFAAMTSVIV